MRKSHDPRVRVLVLTVLGIGVAGLIIANPWWGGDFRSVDEDPVLSPDRSLADAARSETVLDPEFLAAVSALKAGDHPAAVLALLSFLDRAPHVPEVHVNLGFAYLGTAQPLKAESAFEQALELRPDQANAYYGLGLVYEGRGDLESARGAMRTFIHLTSEDDPWLRKARAALWEWEAGLQQPD